MKKTIYSIIFLLLANTLFAQQDANYNFYLFNKLLINPGYTGGAERLSFTALYRNQWANIKGAPQEFTFSVHSPLANDRHALGLNLLNDVIGPYNNLNVSGSYAFRLPINKYKLGIGIQAGFNQYSTKWSALTAFQNGDGTYQNQTKSVFKPIVGLGIFFSNKTWAVGFSVPNIMGNKLDVSPKNNLAIKENVHYYLTAEYLVRFKKTNAIKLKPSILAKYTNGGPFNLDANLYLIFKDVFWLGGGYRTDNSGSISALVNIDKVKNNKALNFRIGYAYEIANSTIRKISAGSHEVILGFDIARADQRIISPRYF